MPRPSLDSEYRVPGFVGADSPTADGSPARTNSSGQNWGRVSAGPCGVIQAATCRLVRQDAICCAVPYTPPRCFSGAAMTPATWSAVSV